MKRKDWQGNTVAGWREGWQAIITPEWAQRDLVKRFGPGALKYWQRYWVEATLGAMPCGTVWAYEQAYEAASREEWYRGWRWGIPEE